MKQTLFFSGIVAITSDGLPTLDLFDGVVRGKWQHRALLGGGGPDIGELDCAEGSRGGPLWGLVLVLSPPGGTRGKVSLMIQRCKRCRVWGQVCASFSLRDDREGERSRPRREGVPLLCVRDDHHPSRTERSAFPLSRSSPHTVPADPRPPLKHRNSDICHNSPRKPFGSFTHQLQGPQGSEGGAWTRACQISETSFLPRPRR